MMHKRPSAQKGMSMVTVVFLLVVLAGVASYIVNITQIQQASTVLRFLEARAYQVAQSGAEYGKYEVFNRLGPEDKCTPGSPIEKTITFTKEQEPEPAFDGFTLKTNISCQKTTDKIILWTVVSEAYFRELGDPLHVNRGIKVQFSHGI